MPNSCPLCKSPGNHFYEDSLRKWNYLRCDNCELIWKAAENLPTAEEERDHYGTHQNSPDDPNYRSFLNRLWQPLKAQLSIGAAGLDYGSGPGPTLHRMAQKDGFDCTHYDPFFRPEESVFEKRYDFITCSETAEHFHNPGEEFKRLAGLLKPSGILGMMTTMHHSNIDFANWHYRRDPTHVAFYNRKTFENIADLFAFTEVEFCDSSVVLIKK